MICRPSLCYMLNIWHWIDGFYEWDVIEVVLRGRFGLVNHCWRPLGPHWIILFSVVCRGTSMHLACCVDLCFLQGAAEDATHKKEKGEKNNENYQNVKEVSDCCFVSITQCGQGLLAKCLFLFLPSDASTIVGLFETLLLLQNAQITFSLQSSSSTWLYLSQMFFLFE